MTIPDTIKIIIAMGVVGLALYIFSPMGVVGGFYVGLCVSAFISYRAK
jgi:hypothetical protein